MAKRINDILDKLIEMDHTKGKAKPPETGVAERRQQDIEGLGRADPAAPPPTPRRRMGRERVARILETGFIE
ncbi:MAG: hypothetical protein U0768_08790 [Anaerolineae bacterium]